jgi:hypothetical protein
MIGCYEAVNFSTTLQNQITTSRWNTLITYASCLYSEMSPAVCSTLNNKNSDSCRHGITVPTILHRLNLQFNIIRSLLKFQMVVIHMKTTTPVLKILQPCILTTPRRLQAVAAITHGSNASSTRPQWCYDEQRATIRNSHLFMCMRQGLGRGRWRCQKETSGPQYPLQLFFADTVPTAISHPTTTGDDLLYWLLMWL